MSFHELEPLPLIGKQFTDLTDKNHDLPWTSPYSRPSGFLTCTVPQISLPSYLSRIFKYSKTTVSLMMLSVYLVERLMKKHPYFIVTRESIYPLILTSVLIVSKFFEDRVYSNTYFGQIGGFDNIHSLEVEFLTLLDFNVYISQKHFLAWRSRLVRFVFRHTLRSLPINNVYSPYQPVNSIPTPELKSISLQSLSIGFKLCAEACILSDPTAPWIVNQAYFVLREAQAEPSFEAYLNTSSQPRYFVERP